MIRLHFQEPQTPAWNLWRQKVQTEIAALSDAGPPYTVKDDLYKEQRETIFACYLNKCAYCEGQYRLTANEGDVEHYRPKGRVRDKENHIVKIVWAGAQVNHPGYWWLASEWTNLLPCCSDCNRKRKHNHVTLDQNNQATVTTDRTIAGKKDAFPLHGPLRANGPNDPLQVEQPLLIDPTLRDPGQHIDWWINELRFPMMTARLHGAAADPFAAVSIKVLGLNRQGLVEERGSLLQDLAATFEIIRDLIRAAGSMAPSAQRDETIAKAVFHLNRVRAKGESTERYSAVARAYVGKAEQAIGKELNDALQSLED